MPWQVYSAIAITILTSIIVSQKPLNFKHKDKIKAAYSNKNSECFKDCLKSCDRK